MALNLQEIYYGIAGQKHGPVDSSKIHDLIETGVLSLDDYLWDEGAEDWVAVRHYPFLYQEGKNFGDSLQSPSSDPPNLDRKDPVPGSSYREATPVEYAQFHQRFGAWFVDTLIMLLPGYMWLMVCLEKIDIGEEELSAIMLGTAPEGDERYWQFQMLYYSGYGFVRWLYEAGLESSGWQATVGKRIMGLVVTDTRGYRLSFVRASVRYFAKIPSQIPFYAGYTILFFTHRRQTLHDILARTLVLRR